MEISYKQKNNLEKFGQRVYNLLVENFPQTFFVGGMPRDLLLGRKITDIDIATIAKPDQVINILGRQGIAHNDSYKRYGNVIAKNAGLEVEVTAFRKDLQSQGRYPKVTFVNNAKADSQRRDFTINALYLGANADEILDFHRGLEDIKNKQIKFIGEPGKRIIQDPLRIIRALRFALILKFKLEHKTFLAIKNNFHLVDNLTKTKVEKEIIKIADAGKRNILKKVINNPKLLDKYFK